MSAFTQNGLWVVAGWSAFVVGLGSRIFSGQLASRNRSLQVGTR